MRTLENRIPPPLVALVLAAGMGWLSGGPSRGGQADSARLGVAALLAVIGVGCALAGSVSFRRARTTVNPLRPERASALVATGVYRLTRNPMYLGMLLGLLAVGVVLWSWWSVAGPVAFVLYMNRFQIGPEEAALHAKFGDQYLAYKHRVRRWL